MNTNFVIDNGIIVVDVESSCPCGSEQPVETCCLHNNKLQLKQVRLALSGPKTGYAHPNCYARALRDCSPKISREHFISRGILERLESRGALRVGKFPWITEEDGKRLSPDALASNVLCQRHNGALSPLDEVGIRLFKSIDQVADDIRHGVTHNRLFLFNGHDIERWMLKLLCGFVASGNAVSPQGRITGWTPDLTWLRILFGQNKFKRDWGLYVPSKLAVAPPAMHDLSIKPWFVPENDVFCLDVMIAPYPFTLIMGDPRTIRQGTRGEELRHHPQYISLTNNQGACAKVIWFVWNGPGGKQGISFHGFTA